MPLNLRGPRRTVCLSTFFCAFLLSLAGCGGDGGGGPAGPDGEGDMTATIDGDPWSSTEGAAIAQDVPGVPGAFVIQGTRVGSGDELTTINLTLYNVAGPGEYALGVSPTNFGGTGLVVVGEVGMGWSTPLTGAAGTVEITALTPQRIAGTFDFVARGLTNGATGLRTVADGSFDLDLNSGGSLEAVPANAGSRVSAVQFGGAAWNSATVVSTSNAGVLIVSASNTEYTLSITIPSATGPDTYPLNASNTIVVSGGGEVVGNCCWGMEPGSTGTIVIEELGVRAKGSFEAELVPSGGQVTPLVIAGGSFDVGLP